MYNPIGGIWTDVSDLGMYYWTKDIVIDPNDVAQNTWYVSVFSGWGGASNGLGGLYKTINRGASWTKLTGNTIDRATSITFNPTNANQIYMTTEVQGLWISNNINATTPSFSNVPSYPFQQPERVFFNPYNTNEMWVTSFGNGMKMGSITVSGLVDFSDANEENFSYPNPSNGLITIKSKEISMAKIFNCIGEQVSEVLLEKENNTIDLRFLNDGIYFIKLNDRVEKIILQR